MNKIKQINQLKKINIYMNKNLNNLRLIDLEIGSINQEKTLANKKNIGKHQTMHNTNKHIDTSEREGKIVHALPIFTIYCILSYGWYGHLVTA